MSHLPLSVSAFVVCQDLFSIHAILRCTTYTTIMKCDRYAMHVMFCVQRLLIKANSGSPDRGTKVSRSRRDNLCYIKIYCLLHSCWLGHT